MNETHRKFGYVTINIEIVKSSLEITGVYEFYT